MREVVGIHAQSIAAYFGDGGKRRKIAAKPELEAGDAVISRQARGNVPTIVKRLKGEDDGALDKPDGTDRLPSTHEFFAVVEAHLLEEGLETVLLCGGQARDEQIGSHSVSTSMGMFDRKNSQGCNSDSLERR
jgi:hypothetical protein